MKSMPSSSIRASAAEIDSIIGQTMIMEIIESFHFRVKVTRIANIN